jgi:hypothetical protein
MKRLLSPDWLPVVAAGALSAIVVHWTGGNRKCSLLDRTHYHFIIDGDCKIFKGLFSVLSNARPFKRRTGYAAHALNFNAGSIGVSLCGMAGAKESPFQAGAYPITQEMWATAIQVVAECCIAYNIPVTPKTVLQHGEIQANCGVIQKGKWDVCRLPWAPQKSPKQVCDEFREQVKQRIKELKAEAAPVVIPKRKRLIIEIGGKKAEVKEATKNAGIWSCSGTALSDAVFSASGIRYAFGGTMSLRSHLTLFKFTVMGGSMGSGILDDDIVRIQRLAS